MLIHIKRNAELFGPYSVEEAREYLSSGRLVLSDFAQLPGTTDWIPLASVPGLRSATPPPPPPGPAEPPTVVPTATQSAGHRASPLLDPAAQPAAQRKGLAITSLVLGLFSLTCLVFFTGVPAIICGHLARSRARRSPGQYGGAGFALAGLITGYIGVLIIMPALGLPALARAKYKAQSISCSNNLKHIGLAFRCWAIDNDGNFPFNLSTNKGGTSELSMQGSDGFDRNAALHFQVLSNELSTPKLLVCPADPNRQPALTFLSLQPANVSYQLRSGMTINDTTTPQEILAVCPNHNHVLLCDGSVQTRRKDHRQ